MNGLIIFSTFLYLNLNLNKDFFFWGTVSSQSYFCWLYSDSPSLAIKNIINLISILTIRWCLCVESCLCCWKRVFAMTSVFCWQNSVSLCPASFCTPRPNFPVTPGISWFPTFAFSPLKWKGHLLWVLVLELLVGLHRTIQLQLLQHYWFGHTPDYVYIFYRCLNKIYLKYVTLPV